MISKKTVFILGAGASAGVPLNFPINSRLRDVICKSLRVTNDKVHKIAKAVAEEVEDIPEYEKHVLEFRNRFYRSSEQTIDAFIRNNSVVYGKIAKYAIAQVLLELENEEVLHSSPSDNWYVQLYQLMKTSPPEDFNQNRVSFITFNYDLSL